jgi:cytochrome c-type biogenesis protein CcmH
MSGMGQTRTAAHLRTLLRALLLVAAISAASVAIAQGPAPDATPAAPGVARPNAEDPALEKRLIAVTKELRCLVCQNESIADSHAGLAIDMRNEIREQLKSGMTDRQVLDFMVARYGNFVRFRPPLDWTTIALWFGPALLLVIGLGMLVMQLRQRRTLAAARATPALSDAERAALASRLLDEARAAGVEVAVEHAARGIFDEPQDGGIALIERPTRLLGLRARAWVIAQGRSEAPRPSWAAICLA